MNNGFDKYDFMQYLEKTFTGFDNSFLRETINNLINYGLKNYNHSLDQFCYWLSDMLPEIEFKEVAAFMDDSLLTKEGQSSKQNMLKEFKKEEKVPVFPEFTLEGLQELLEDKEWWVSSCSFSGNIPGWEIGQYSPAGEDFSFAIQHNNNVLQAIKEIKEYANNFDVEEHIEMWIEAKNNGVSGIPSAASLVEDAEDIQQMLKDLASDVLTWEANQPKATLDSVIKTCAEQVNNTSSSFNAPDLDL